MMPAMTWASVPYSAAAAWMVGQSSARVNWWSGSIERSAGSAGALTGSTGSSQREGNQPSTLAVLLALLQPYSERAVTTVLAPRSSTRMGADVLGAARRRTPATV